MAMPKVARLIDAVEWIWVAGSAASLVLIMVLTSVDVFLRKLSPCSVPALFEIISDYLMVALVFLAVSRVYRLGGHVRVTLIEQMLPDALRRILQRIMDAAALLFFLLIAVMGWQSARSAMLFQEVSSSVLAYPLAPALFIVPAGAGLTCLRALQALCFGAPPRPAAGSPAKSPGLHPSR